MVVPRACWRNRLKDAMGPYSNEHSPSLQPPLTWGRDYDLEPHYDNPENIADERIRRLGGPVKEILAGVRIDRFLAEHYPFLTRSGWQKRLARRRVYCGGRPVEADYVVQTGDQVALYYPEDAEPKVNEGIHVLVEQAGVMAVYKPPHLPMHANGPYQTNTFVDLVHQEIGEEWNIVHRLDKETSGIVICAATGKLRAKLTVMLQASEVRKHYLALVHGPVELSDWMSDGAIGDLEASAIRIKKWVVPNGLPALTAFSRWQQSPTASLLEARPLTGRTNQIRIHAAYAGYPLIGDKLFHRDEQVFLEYHERGTTPWCIEQTGFSRCCLHAAGIRFRHPELAADFTAVCGLPQDLMGLARQHQLLPELANRMLNP